MTNIRLHSSSFHPTTPRAEGDSYRLLRNSLIHRRGRRAGWLLHSQSIGVPLALSGLLGRREPALNCVKHGKCVEC
jgi:hypothetical protein